MLQMLWNFVIGTPSVALIIVIAAFIATVRGTMWVTGVNARLNVLGDKSGKGGVIEGILTELKEIRTELRGFSERLAAVETTVGILQTTVGGIQTTVSTLQTTVGSIQANVGTLQTTVGSIQQALKAQPPHVQTSSPLVLSDSGKRVAKAIDADDLAQRYAHKVKLPKDANAFNIQEACFEYAKGDLLGAMKKEDRQRVELYAFDAGDKIAYVNDVLGIKLRDVILKERGLYTKKLDASNVA